MSLVPESLLKTASRQLLVAQKASPKVLFVAGLVGVVGGAILACRATTKLEPKLEEFKKELDTVSDKREVLTETTYSSRQYHKDLTSAYVHHTFSLVRLYAPSVILGSLGIAALTTSHVTLTRRNASLTAAYSALSMSYDAYREKIREEYGEERELELHQGAIIKALNTGDDVKVAGRGYSVYAKCFDEGSIYWDKDPELNKVFIQCQQNYANHRLHARGFIFLNEVYEMLGFEPTQAGQCVGWFLGTDGDNYIDFGLFVEANAPFINGYERNVFLDFNVDGLILDKI